MGTQKHTMNAPSNNQSADPNELTWQDVRELGIDPAPAGLIEDSDTAEA